MPADLPLSFVPRNAVHSATYGVMRCLSDRHTQLKTIPPRSHKSRIVYSVSYNYYFIIVCLFCVYFSCYILFYFLGYHVVKKVVYNNTDGHLWLKVTPWLKPLPQQVAAIIALCIYGETVSGDGGASEGRETACPQVETGVESERQTTTMLKDQLSRADHQSTQAVDQLRTALDTETKHCQELHR